MLRVGRVCAVPTVIKRRKPSVFQLSAEVWFVTRSRRCLICCECAGGVNQKAANVHGARVFETRSHPNVHFLV
jgi:hypothetical protein